MSNVSMASKCRTCVLITREVQELDRLIDSIERCAIEGQLKQDTGYLSKILPDLRKARQIVEGGIDG